MSTNFKVLKCSLDQNLGLFLSAPKNWRGYNGSFLAVYVKVTHRPVAPPRAPLKKFRKPKKILLPQSTRSQSFKSIPVIQTKLWPFFNVRKKTYFWADFGFFHLQGRGNPPNPKYYNKYCSPRGQELCSKVSEKPWIWTVAPSHTVPLKKDFDSWKV